MTWPFNSGRFELPRVTSTKGTTDASVSAGEILWGGVTFAAPNAGVSVVDGDLVLANAAGSTQFNTSTRTPPLVTASLTTLGGISEVGTRQVLIILDVESYPNAVFVPERAEGLPFPLPESGAVTFRLVGTLTIHGTAREVAWDVAARRTGGEVSGTATSTITFSDFELEPPSVAAVISVSDEIRLEIALVANVAR